MARSITRLRRDVAAIGLSGISLAFAAGCAVLPSGAASQLPDALPDSIARNPNLAATVPSSVADDGRLTVAVALTGAPLAYLDRGKAAGAEADLAKALGGVLGLPVDLVPEQVSRIDYAVGRGEYDLGIGSLPASPTGESASARVSYLSGELRLAVRADEGATPDRSWLCGKKVAVIDGLISEDQLDELNARCDDAGQAYLDTAAVDSYEDGLGELSGGRVAGILGPAPDLAALASSHARDVRIAPFTVMPGQYAIAVRNESTWPAVVQKALKEVQVRGLYHSVMRAWGVSSAEIGDFALLGPVRPTPEVVGSRGSDMSSQEAAANGGSSGYPNAYGDGSGGESPGPGVSPSSGQ